MFKREGTFCPIICSFVQNRENLTKYRADITTNTSLFPSRLVKSTASTKTKPFRGSHFPGWLFFEKNFCKNPDLDRNHLGKHVFPIY